MPSGAATGNKGCVGSAFLLDSHDLAELTSRVAFSTPRFCASRPAMYAGLEFQGNASAPSTNSFSPGMYKDEGSSVSAATSPGLTSWGTLNNSISRDSSSLLTEARALLVVPRSIPNMYGGIRFVLRTSSICFTPLRFRQARLLSDP